MTDAVRVAIVGHVGYDVTTTREGTRTVRAGAAYYTAVGASCVSRKIGVVARIGSDYESNVLDEIADVTGVVLMKGAPTSRFFHNYSDDFSSRTFRAELGAGAHLTPSDIPDGYLSASYVHIATMPPSQQLEFIHYLRQRSNAFLSIDTLEQYILGEAEKVREVLSLADIVFLNRRERDLISSIAPRILVVKKGAAGAELHIDSYKIEEPAPQARVVDPTGSGDVLAGALLAGLAITSPPQDALREAVMLASRSVEDAGVDHLLGGARDPFRQPSQGSTDSTNRTLR